VTEHTLDQLVELLTTAARARGQSDLTCAPDVLDALAEAIPAAEPEPPGMPSTAWMMSVNLIRGPEMEPGRFRLVKHDNCEVDTERLAVYHDRCTVTADGIVLTGTPA
jgi:hypothetical protein